MTQQRDFRHQQIGKAPDGEDFDGRKLIVQTSLTLDGVMQAAGPEEDQSGGFPQGGWLATTGDEQASEVMDEATTAR